MTEQEWLVSQRHFLKELKMPTYDYECPDCGHKFQRFHSMSADPMKDCTECGQSHVKRLIGAGAGLIFKGSGFYITDYRSENYNSAKKAAEASETETKTASAADSANSTSSARGSGSTASKTSTNSAQSSNQNSS